MTGKKRFRILEAAVLIAFVLSAAAGMTGFAATCDNIRDNVLRLHVLANSDSEGDQALKLQVRDALLAAGDEAFDGSVDAQEAQRRITPRIAELEALAEQVVRDYGYDYPVRITVSREYFDTRTYDTVTLPAGRYQAVRVIIGSGQGHNWWCVMFPPMCLPAAQKEAEIDAVLTQDEVELVESTPTYEPRFKIVELYEKLREKFAAS